jgi:fibronectin-binding autotransporter adhesin
MTRRLAGLSIVFLLTVLALLPAAELRAATALYFDAEGGTKTWDYSSLNWSSDPGPPYDRAWADGSDAVFEGAGGVVNVSGTINSVNSLYFAVSGYTVGSSPNSGTISLTGSGGNITTLSGTTTINSSITYVGPNTGLTKLGDGTLVLCGYNANTGPTNINAGTLRLGKSNCLYPQTAVTLANVAGATFDLNNTTQTIASLSGGGNLGGNLSFGSMGLGRLTIGYGSNAPTTTYAGVISGTGEINFNYLSPGSLTLTGKSTFSGTVNCGGVIILDNENALPNAIISFSTSSATLQFGNISSAKISRLNNSNVPGGNSVSLSNVNGQPVALTIGVNISEFDECNVRFTGSGSLTKVGACTLTLGGYNTFSGDTKIVGGILKAPGGLWNSTLDYDNYGGTYSMENTYSNIFGGLKGNQNMQLLSGLGYSVRLVVGTNNQSTTYGGVFSDSGHLAKVGSGTWTLTAANVHTGKTIAASGKLNLANPLALQYSTLSLNDQYVYNGSTNIKYSGGTVVFDPAVASHTFNIGGLEGIAGRNIVLQDGLDGTGNPITLRIGSNISYAICTYSGVLAGAGSIAKIGLDTLTLAGANTYSGTTTVLGGTLNVTGSLANNGSNKIFVAANVTNFGGTIARNVAVGGGYAGFGSTAFGAGTLGSAADLLAGTNTETAKMLAMQWRGLSGADLAANLVSDVFNLSGMVNTGGQTDAFALKMTYSVDALPGGAANEAALAAAGSIFLAWFNADSQWVDATTGNTGNNASAAQRGFVGSFADFQTQYGTTLGNYIGAYGVDLGSHSVWAVLNHNSQFAAAVPEPGTLILLAAALGIGLLMLRRKS